MTRPTSQFDFNQPVAYDAQAKHQFHTNAHRQLIAFAEALGVNNSDYDLRSNQAGVAVSGEITLHSDRLYIQVSQSVMGPIAASCSAVATVAAITSAGSTISLRSICCTSRNSSPGGSNSPVSHNNPTQ